MDLLQKNPAERPGSVAEIRQRLASMGLSIVSTGNADKTPATLATDETLPPPPAASGPSHNVALAETALPPPAATGPGDPALADTALPPPAATGPGDPGIALAETALPPPAATDTPRKPRTALWVGAGLVVLALTSYPLIRYLAPGREPAPILTAVDSAVPTPDSAVDVETPDVRPPADLRSIPDARRPAKEGRPKPKGAKKGRPTPKKPKKKPRKPDAGKPGPTKRLGLPSADQDKAAVKGGKRPR
jgi:hypothetical protein